MKLFFVAKFFMILAFTTLSLSQFVHAHPNHQALPSTCTSRTHLSQHDECNGNNMGTSCQFSYPNDITTDYTTTNLNTVDNMADDGILALCESLKKAYKDLQDLVQNVNSKVNPGTTTTCSQKLLFCGIAATETLDGSGAEVSSCSALTNKIDIDRTWQPNDSKEQFLVSQSYPCLQPCPNDADGNPPPANCCLERGHHCNYAYNYLPSTAQARIDSCNTSIQADYAHFNSVNSTFRSHWDNISGDFNSYLAGTVGSFPGMTLGQNGIDTNHYDQIFPSTLTAMGDEAPFDYSQQGSDPCVGQSNQNADGSAAAVSSCRWNQRRALSGQGSGRVLWQRAPLNGRKPADRSISSISNQMSQAYQSAHGSSLEQDLKTTINRDLASLACHIQ